MPAANNYYGPIGYEIWWPIIGVVLVIACIGWIVWLYLPRNKNGIMGVPEIPLRHVPNEAFLARIDELLGLFSQGKIDARKFHQELSITVREYAQKRTGIPAANMTLEELRESRMAPVAEAVEQMYPLEFQADLVPAGGDSSHPAALEQAVAQAASAARNLVTTWI